MPSIGDLPLEILDLVASSISLRDVISCLLVNHEWHALFERVLYQSVDTRQRDIFLAFMERLHGTSLSTLPLGHCVRELKICDGFMTCKRMNQLLELCPFVNSLTFRWQDSKAHETHIASTVCGANRRYFGTPERIMKKFPRIIRLTLECEAKNRRVRTKIQLEDVSLYLNATQNLRYLALHGVVRKLTYNQMDSVHEACPNLAHLKITISTSDFTSYVDILTSPTEAAAENDARIQNLDGPEWPAKAARMQRLEVSDESIPLDMERWVRYAAAMYPHLRALHFGNWCWERSMNWPQDSKPQNWRCDGEDKGLLAQRCPELHTIELRDVSLPKEAMRQIFSGSKLNKVTLKGDHMELIDAEGYKTMVGLLSPKVHLLRLAFPSHFIGEPFADSMTCDRLVELSIVCSNVWYELAHVQVDRVLQSCPVLKDLTLVGVHAKASLTSHITSSLTTLRLRRVDFRCGSLLSFLSKNCPQLSHLHMYHCTGPQYRLGSRFTFNFASQHLQSLCIYEHYCSKHAATRVKLISVCTSNDTSLCDVYLVPDITPPHLNNTQSLEFDDSPVTDPNPGGKSIKLCTNEARDLLELNNALPVLGKRKRADSPESDSLLHRCKQELEGGGSISIRCASIAKLIVNGAYIERA